LRKKRRVEEYDAEMKDQERALKMQSSSTSLSSSGKFNPSPVNASSPMKRVTSPTSPNKPSGSPSGSPTKEWKVKNRTARLQKWELAAPEPEVTSSFFACLDFSKIFPSLYDLDAWYEKRLQRLPRSQWEIIVTRRKGVELAVPRGNSERENVYRRAHAEAKLVADREHTHYEAFLVGLVNHKATPNMRTLFQQALDHELTRHPAMLYQHVQLNSVSNSQCKAPILLAKEGLITSKPYHGVHGNAQKAEITSLYDFITKESKKWSRRTSWVTGDAVNIGEDGEHRTLTHAATTKKGRGRKVANKYHVTAEFPEVWTCGGGVHGVVCIMRVQDQIERIPRGSPVVECITGLGAVSLRCGFQNKLLLCDNDHNLFATHVCKRITSKETRFLSVDAGYKLRHSDIPLRELPTADQFYPIVMQTLFASRHDHGASRGYVVRIQGLYHFKAARNRIKYLKMAIDERLALDREMKRLEEEAVREEEEDDINDSELRNAMFDACIPHEDKEYSKQQLQLHSTTIHASTPVVGSELEVHNSEYLSHSHPGPNPRVIKLSQFSTSPASESLSEAEFQVEIQHANHQDEETDLEKRAVQTQRLTSLNL
jgi:hypothetical protein